MDTLKSKLKNINYVLILRYVIYFGLLFLFLKVIGVLFGVSSNRQDDLCENLLSVDENFKLPSNLLVVSVYYFGNIFSTYVSVCQFPFIFAIPFFVFFTITYLLFKSIGDRVLPVKKPWRRDVSEVLIAVAYSRWQVLGFLFTHNLLSLLPAMFLVLLSETFYVFMLIIIRRLAIKFGIKNPLRFILILIFIIPFVFVVADVIRMFNKIL